MIAAKTGTDKVDALWKQMQEALQRNTLLAGPVPSCTSPGARLMQHADTAAAQSHYQMLDRLVMQVDEAVRSAQRHGAESKTVQIDVARSLISDAHAAKQVVTFSLF